MKLICKITVFLFVLIAPLYGNPVVYVDLPQENHVFNSPIVEVTGTVENSLTLPDNASSVNLKTWVYYSVDGKKFKTARTHGSGPDSEYHYGKTSSVALFSGIGDTSYGTRSVRVYAKDNYGRESAMITRTIIFNQAKLPIKNTEYKRLFSKISSLIEKNRKNIIKHKDYTEIEKIDMLVDYYGEILGKEICQGDYNNYKMISKEHYKAKDNKLEKILDKILKKARTYFFNNSTHPLKNGCFY